MVLKCGASLTGSREATLVEGEEDLLQRPAPALRAPGNRIQAITLVLCQQQTLKIRVLPPPLLLLLQNFQATAPQLLLHLFFSRKGLSPLKLCKRKSQC